MVRTKKATKKVTTAPKKPVVHAASKHKAPAMRSFAPSHPTEPFFTFRMTHQTFYWAVLAILVLALGIWVVTINDKVQRIYDQIDASNAALTEDTPSNKKP